MKQWLLEQCDEIKVAIGAISITVFIIFALVATSLLNDLINNHYKLKEQEIRGRYSVKEAIESSNRDIVEKCIWTNERPEAYCNFLIKELNVK